MYSKKCFSNRDINLEFSFLESNDTLKLLCSVKVFDCFFAISVRIHYSPIHGKWFLQTQIWKKSDCGVRLLPLSFLSPPSPDWPIFWITNFLISSDQSETYWVKLYLTTRWRLNYFLYDLYLISVYLKSSIFKSNFRANLKGSTQLF